MLTFDEWAMRWRVPAEAVAQLREMFVHAGLPGLDMRDPANSEARVQSEQRLGAAAKGVFAMRNNVGALQDKTGRPVRYGLLNDSKAINTRIKSADLIGIRRVLITQQHVGQVLGQFWSREIKHRGWHPGEDKVRERAQYEWCLLVNSWGGDAKITANSDDI